MKIDGKPFGKIFAEMPFSQKIVVIIGSIFISFTIGYLFYLVAIFEPPKKAPEIVALAKKKNIVGLIDPSLGADDKIKVLAYTVFIPEENGLFSTEIHTSIAVTKCISWNDLPGKIEARPDILIGPDLVTPVTKGIWRAETPSIVYDPADKGKEWKLFAYRYFWADNSSLARLYGAIVMRSSSEATAMEWSREEWLFSAAEGTPPAPYGNAVKNHLNKLHPSLANVYFYARPSVVMVGDAMVMSLSAFIQGKETVDRIILIASHDHGKTWRYLGTPLKDSDLQSLGGFNRLNGGSLFLKNNVLYLSVAMGNTQSDSTGAYIFGFENASHGSLDKDPKTGAPAIISHIPTIRNPPTQLGGGALAYHDACKERTFISESIDNKRFDIYAIPRTPIP